MTRWTRDAAGTITGPVVLDDHSAVYSVATMPLRDRVAYAEGLVGGAMADEPCAEIARYVGKYEVTECD